MIRTLILAIVLLGLANAWTNTPSYIIARIAEKDLEQYGKQIIRFEPQVF